MYRYYQTGEKTPWQVIDDGPDAEQKAITAGAKKVTILAVSEVIDDNTDRSKLTYKGPFYVDIDSKNDLSSAIESSQDLVRKLYELQVPDQAIQIFASGSKGFHIIVAASVFSSNRPLHDLPAIYKEIALELYVLGMDFQVYSGGRGVCWRLPNIQRDNGHYRVPITADELFSMTPDMYSQVTSTPRIMPAPQLDPQARSIAFEALMERAKRRARMRPKQTDPITEEALSVFKVDPPACISELVEYKIKPTHTFNQVGMQVGIFVARSGMEPVHASALVSRLAAHGTSSTYGTPRARETHVKGLVDYMSSSPSKKFSCNAIRALLLHRPCAECPINKKGTDADVDPGEDIGIIERPDGYYIISANGERRISTFVINPVDAYFEIPQGENIPRRIGATVEVSRDGQVIGRPLLRESGWASKSQFKAELSGMHNLAFMGTEDDIQKIKHVVFHEDREMGEIVQVYTAGIHRHRVGERDIMVYVEPGFSINQFRVRGTHRLEGKINSPPKIKEVSLPSVGDTSMEDFLSRLLQVNEPALVAQVLGWFCACHLKTHLVALYGQFPLLGLWGSAGCGKTMTASLFSSLSGCFSESGDGSVSLADITPFAMVNYCSGTTTVPRILEEYNKSKMPQKNYDYLGEIMKMAWDQHIKAMGTLRKSNANGRGRSGAEVIEYPITSPLLVISEQAPQMPALKQRMVQVQMNSEITQTKAFSDAFHAIYSKREILLKMAKAMVIGALNFERERILESMSAYAEELPEKLIARPRYAYQVIFLGLEFLKTICDDLHIQLDLSPYSEALHKHVQEESGIIARDKMRSEIDIVMDEIGLMAQSTLNKTENWLVRGTHYAISNDRLFLDLPVAYAAYRAYKTRLHEPIVIETAFLFKTLVKQEPYCISIESVQGAKLMNINRATLELDMRKMAKKGIDITMYG